MIQSVVEFFTGEDSDKNQQQQQPQNPPAVDSQSAIDSVISPRSARLIVPQQRLSTSSQSNIVHHSRVSSASIIMPGIDSLPNQQLQQQQQHQDQNPCNQSILSIITQANKEQLYVYCPTHTDYFITNICTHSNCIEPLCPECMINHNDLHTANGTNSQLQNIQSQRESAIDHIQDIVQTIQSDYSNLQPTLERQAKDSQKRNIDSALALKAQIVRCVDAFFEQILQKLHQTDLETQSHFEKLDAVVRQRLSQQQALLQELQSPLYIKALIDTLENPTTVELEQAAFSHIIDSIKEQNAMSFAKSDNIDDQLSSTLTSFYSYQKKQKIFLADTKITTAAANGMRHSSNLRSSAVSPPRKPLGQLPTSQVEGSGNIASSRMYVSAAKTEPNIATSRVTYEVLPLTQRNGVVVQQAQSPGFLSELGNQLSSNTTGNKKIKFMRKRNTADQEQRNTQQDYEPTEEDLSAISGERHITHQEHAMLFTNYGSRVNEDFTEGLTEEDITGYAISKQMIPSTIPVTTSSTTATAATTVVKSQTIVDKTLQRARITAVEEVHPSTKQFHVFVEGTRILHSIDLNEYKQFPKSAIQTEFLDIHFKIPINHASIQVPGTQLTLLTGGIMYDTNKKKAVRDVYRYDKKTNSLERMAGMLYARQLHSLAHVDGIVYAIGGCSELDESSSMSKCEYFNVEKANWFEMPDCIYKASGAGITVVNQKYIYKFGGKDDVVKPVNSIECYDIAKRIWHPVQFDLVLNGFQSLSYQPIVRQINHDEIIIAGGYQHSIATQNVYVAAITNNNNNKSGQFSLSFKELQQQLPSNGIDFQYAQSFFENNQLLMLKNPTKLSVGDTKIFLAFNGESWNVQ